MVMRKSMETLNTEVPSETHTDFRLFLQEELVRRIRSKPGYSMRAFARFLGVDSSRLSKMLRGERPIKPHFVEAFGQRVGLSPEKIEAFKNQAEVRRARRNPRLPQRPYQQVGMDTFEVISDWQHSAIIELMRIREFR